MRRQDAEDLVAIIAAATAGPGSINEGRAAFWIDQLEHLDAELASQAVVAGIKVWERFPSWSQFGYQYQLLAKRKAESEERQTRIVAEQRGLEKMPFWVKRWIIARLGSDRPDMRRFPEQGEWADIRADEMPLDQYRELAERLTDAKAIELLLRSQSNRRGVGDGGIGSAPA